MAYAFFSYALTILFFLLTRLNYPQLSIPLLLFPHFFLAYLVGGSRDGWLLSLLQLELPLFSGLLRSNCVDFFGWSTTNLLHRLRCFCQIYGKKMRSATDRPTTPQKSQTIAYA